MRVAVGRGRGARSISDDCEGVFVSDWMRGRWRTVI